MSHYRANVRDIEFNLFEVFRVQDRFGSGPFVDADEETARALLGEVAALAEGPLGDSYESGDRNPVRFDPADPRGLPRRGHQALLPRAVGRRVVASRGRQRDRRHGRAPVGAVGRRPR